MLHLHSNRTPTRAELQLLLREIHFDPGSLSDPIEGETADMRSGDRRLATFERNVSTMALDRLGISKNEVAALSNFLCSEYTATAGAAHIVFLKLRCSFFRHSFRRAQSILFNTQCAVVCKLLL